MKLTILIAVCMAFVAVQSAAVIVGNPVVVDKAILEKQRFIFEICLRMDQPLMFEEWIKYGEKFLADKTLFKDYNNWMVEFYHYYKVGGLLPVGEFYGAMERNHLVQTYGLFGFFYHAKDYDTFVRNVAWARLNVNEEMFISALQMAVVHREDMQGIIMPQIYEIFPQMFFSSKYIYAAEKFDWDTFNRQIMLEKELKTIYKSEYPDKIFGDRFYLKDFKMWQWWKLMGLDDGFHFEEKHILNDNFVHFKEYEPVWTSIYNKLKMVYMPVDYTRDVEIFNEESKLSYFTEDIGWNAYWYYLNIDYSEYLSSEVFHLNKDRRGEWWVYNLQQLLARYYMERLSVGLGEIPHYSHDIVYEMGYDPQLVAFNGNGFTFRKNYFELQSYQNLELLNKMENIERRIDDVIATGMFTTKDGTVVDVSKPESVDFYANLLQGNYDVLDKYFFNHWWVLSSKFISGVKDDSFIFSPNVFMNFETMLRDPLCYSMFKMIATKMFNFKYHLKPYTKEELQLPGVQIVDVIVSKLVTYFDLVDTDVSTLLNEKMVFHDGKYVWDKAMLFRQRRLNSKPFNFKVTVKSDKIQDVIVRVFLGPEFDEYGRKLSMVANRENYFEIDEFFYSLTVGENIISHSSKDFDWTASDPHSYSELYNYLMMTYDGKYNFHQNISQSHSLFPDRLVLPRGWPKGMPMVMFFMISPYTAEYKQFATYDHTYLSGIGSGVRHIDSIPFGYPLDRKIEDLYEFYVPNMYFEHVKIYHEENFDKYFPKKYEKFGTFDYDF